jgi:hypothetical protein
MNLNKPKAFDWRKAGTFKQLGYQTQQAMIESALRKGPVQDGRLRSAILRASALRELTEADREKLTAKGWRLEAAE